MFRISLSLQCYHEGKRKEEEENPSAGTDIAGHFQTPTAFWVGLLASEKSFLSSCSGIFDTSSTWFYHSLSWGGRWCPHRVRPGQILIWFLHELFISTLLLCCRRRKKEWKIRKHVTALHSVVTHWNRTASFLLTFLINKCIMFCVCIYIYIYAMQRL